MLEPLATLYITSDLLSPFTSPIATIAAFVGSHACTAPKPLPVDSLTFGLIIKSARPSPLTSARKPEPSAVPLHV